MIGMVTLPVMILIDPSPLERISSFKYTGLSIFIYSNILTLLSKVWKLKYNLSMKPTRNDADNVKRLYFAELGLFVPNRIELSRKALSTWASGTPPGCCDRRCRSRRRCRGRRGRRWCGWPAGSRDRGVRLPGSLPQSHGKRG